MRISAILLLILILQMPGCDLTGGPHKTQAEAQVQLRQYFPNAYVIASPAQGTIVAVTCVHGLGKPVIEEIAEHLDHKRGIERLREARQLPLKLSPYRFLVLVFDEYSIRLDMDTNQHAIVGPDSQIRREYSANCDVFSASALRTRDAAH